jgi:hypothetical protein
LANLAWETRSHLFAVGADPRGGDKQEPKASLARFQFLIFTFVIAGLYLVPSIESGTMIEVPSGALVLLGISGGSYLVSKVESTRAAGVQAAAEETEEADASGKKNKARGRVRGGIATGDSNE